MDRMIYLSMAAARNTLTAQSINNHNLANANTPGFRADLGQTVSLSLSGSGYASRVYAQEERTGVDFRHGRINHTGNELDVAIDGDGWIAVQAMDGSEAYTRAGNLNISSNGLLQTGAGLPVLGNAGPIAIPPSEKLEFGADGTITIRPVGQDEKTLATVDRIKLVNPDNAGLYKGTDGLFRLRSGATAPADATVKIVAGALESSNVNIVEALVQMISTARQFEMSVRAMRMVQQNDEQAAQLFGLS